MRDPTSFNHSFFMGSDHIAPSTPLTLSCERLLGRPRVQSTNSGQTGSTSGGYETATLFWRAWRGLTSEGVFPLVPGLNVRPSLTLPARTSSSCARSQATRLSRVALSGDALVTRCSFMLPIPHITLMMRCSTMLPHLILSCKRKRALRLCAHPSPCPPTTNK